MGCVVTMNVLRQHGKVAWIVPEFKNGRSLWRMAQSFCLPHVPSGIMNISKTERMITTHLGGLFGIYSADNIDAIRNEWFNVVVLDEAARISEEARNDAIGPTLADANGDELDISTPKGLNWFFTEYQKGISDQQTVMSWTAPSCANPNPNIKHAYELAKTRMPELTFRQEWNGEFVDAEGAVFRRIRDAATVEPINEPVKDRQYIAGVDVAASVDYTVVSVMDVQSRQLVYLDRFNRVDYGVLEDRLHSVYERFHLVSMCIESNSIGQPVIDNLNGRGMYVIPFTTTSATKQTIITQLQAAFEHSEIGIINDPILIGELLSFESKRSPSGSFSYSAPEGMHDDCVMSLAIAWHSLLPVSNFVSDPYANW